MKIQLQLFREAEIDDAEHGLCAKGRGGGGCPNLSFDPAHGAVRCQLFGPLWVRERTPGGQPVTEYRRADECVRAGTLASTPQKRDASPRGLPTMAGWEEGK